MTTYKAQQPDGRPWRDLGVALLLCIPLYFYWGWVYQSYWTWFAVGFLHQSPLSYRVAVAFYALVSLAKVRERTDAATETPFGARMFTLLASPLIMWLTGWVLQWFLHFGVSRL